MLLTRTADAVCDPNLDPILIALDGYGSLPVGAATGPLDQHDNQHVVSLVGTGIPDQNVSRSPNLPVEVPSSSYGDTFQYWFDHIPAVCCHSCRINDNL